MAALVVSGKRGPRDDHGFFYHFSFGFNDVIILHNSPTIARYDKCNRKGKGCEGMLLIGIAVIAVIVYFLAKDKKIKFPSSNEAEETLKKRYINGEIDEETYLRMKRTINE
jgi:hypothetical protein